MTEKKKPVKPAKPKKPKGPKAAKGKAVRGKMPVKRSINLILIDEKKINPLQAIPGILAILVLAAVFSKFLVIDRLTAMGDAEGRALRMQANVESARALLDTFGDVEDTYAHYTQQGMTGEELALVDRVRILELVRTMLAEGNATFGPVDFRERMLLPYRAMQSLSDDGFDPDEYRKQIMQIDDVTRDVSTVWTWQVSGNTLRLDITGGTLETMNQVARRLEIDPIVDSCTISQANKQGRSATQDVSATMIVYLVKPLEEANQS